MYALKMRISDSRSRHIDPDVHLEKVAWRFLLGPAVSKEHENTVDLNQQ